METIQYSLSNSRSYSINLDSVIYTHTYSKNEKITIDKNKNLERNVVEEIYTKIEKKNKETSKKETPNKETQIPKHQHSYTKNKVNAIDSSIFDKECLQRYGDTFCILFELNDSDFEARMFKESQLRCIKYISKRNLYNEIPNFLKDRFTVVIIEKSKKNEKHDITSTHTRATF